VVVPAADGTTDFSVLQNELKGKSTSIVMVAFDLLYLNGYDLRKLPLDERKSDLKKLAPRPTSSLVTASKSTAAKCSRTPARLAWKASFPRSAIAITLPAGAATGSRRPANSARP
jgi:hypothetical protein